jgi:hypothetical protein
MTLFPWGPLRTRRWRCALERNLIPVTQRWRELDSKIPVPPCIASGKSVEHLHSAVSGGSSSRRNSSIDLPRAGDRSDANAAPAFDRPQPDRSFETAAYRALGTPALAGAPAAVVAIPIGAVRPL